MDLGEALIQYFVHNTTKPACEVRIAHPLVNTWFGHILSDLGLFNISYGHYQFKSIDVNTEFKRMNFICYFFNSKI